MNSIFSKGPCEVLKQEFSEAPLGHLKEKVLKGAIDHLSYGYLRIKVAQYKTISYSSTSR